MSKYNLYMGKIIGSTLAPEIQFMKSVTGGICINLRMRDTACGSHLIYKTELIKKQSLQK